MSLITVEEVQEDDWVCFLTRNSIFNQLKAAVVYIRTATLFMRDVGGVQMNYNIGTGFIVNNLGYVLTEAGNVPDIHERIQVLSWRDNLPLDWENNETDHVYEVESRGCGSVLLKPQLNEINAKKKFNYLELGNMGSTPVGLEVFTICHEDDPYTFMMGRVAYPNNSRTPPGTIHPPKRTTSLLSSVEMSNKNYPEDMPIIQVNNIHAPLDGRGPMLGAPLFDRKGLVVGMFAFKKDEALFAIESGFLKKAWKKYLPKINRDKGAKNLPMKRQFPFLFGGFKNWINSKKNSRGSSSSSQTFS